MEQTYLVLPSVNTDQIPVLGLWAGASYLTSSGSNSKLWNWNNKTEILWFMRITWGIYICGVLGMCYEFSFFKKEMFSASKLICPLFLWLELFLFYYYFDKIMISSNSTLKRRLFCVGMSVHTVHIVCLLRGICCISSNFKD